MPIYGPSTPIALDLTTLFVVAVCVSALLGVLLLFVWTQDRVRALAWWGTVTGRRRPSFCGASRLHLAALRPARPMRRCSSLAA
jgi:hypothetical protein